MRGLRQLLLGCSLVIFITACSAGQTGKVEPSPTAVAQAEPTLSPTSLPATATPESPTPTHAPTSAPTDEPTVQVIEPAPSPQEPVQPTLEPTEPNLLATDEPLPTQKPELLTPVPPEAVLPTDEAPPPTAELLPTELPAAVETSSLDDLGIKFSPVASGFTKPLFLTHAGDGNVRLFVVEQAGRILLVKAGRVNPTPFLDIVAIVGSDANEQGLLSVAFHPDYTSNGFFFVNYTDKQGDTVIARYSVSGDPDTAVPDSAKILLTINQPYANHNGGQVAFGPDGYLYIGMGDGGAANDPRNNGQNVNVLLGKILRLDVDKGDPYGIPADNPFAANGQGSPEIWSYGWRNPWRFSFDPATGDLYVADVGQNQYEEVDVELAGTPGGQNYGWRIMEASHCFDGNCDATSQGLILPIAEYDHGQGCSVTGGYVYRGRQYPALRGVYFYGDYCSGLIWALRREADGSWSQAQVASSGYTISSFGQDEAGEVYVVNHNTGEIFQLGN